MKKQKRGTNVASQSKVVVTCALTGLLTDPAKFNVPVTPQEMADAAEQSYNAGASVLHCHFRDQGRGNGCLSDLGFENRRRHSIRYQGKSPADHHLHEHRSPRR